MCIENGCIKVGASKKTGDIITPELSCLSGTATIEVQFDAAPYREGIGGQKDPLNGRVDVFTGQEVSSHSLPVATSPAKTVEWTLNDKYEWQHFTVTIRIVYLPTTARVATEILTDEGNTLRRAAMQECTVAPVVNTSSTSKMWCGTFMFPRHSLLTHLFETLNAEATFCALPSRLR